MGRLLKLNFFIMVFVLFGLTQGTVTARADYYSSRTDTVYCTREAGCSDVHLKTAKHVRIGTRLTQMGMYYLEQNPNLQDLYVQDVSNFPEEEIEQLYPYMVKGNVSLAAVLMSYKNYNDSFGDDGTEAYQKIVNDLCPVSAQYMRSCATVVSAAINAAGIGTCDSPNTAGLVTYFEKSSDWKNMGRLRASSVQEGDIIFIDRKSHAKEYESGAMKDDEYSAEVEYLEPYTGGYDSTGHRNYATQDPTGSSSEVFCPDQDGDGEVNDWEAEYWRCYWLRVNPGTGYVPSYDYYYTWKAEAEAAEKAAEEKRRQEEEEKAAKAKKKKKRVIHDHIFVWTGNDVIQRYFPGSDGNIVSGSYSEDYSEARSAAISKYNFTGDYRIYRYVGSDSELQGTGE